MTTSSVRTLVLLPVNGVAVATVRHSSGVSWMPIALPQRPFRVRVTGGSGPLGPARSPVNRIGQAPADVALTSGQSLDCRLHQTREERVRAGRPGAQLGVGLGADEVGVDLARELDVLDELVVGRGAGEDQPGLLLQLTAVGVVDLVAVAVALLDVRLVVVDLADDGALGELGRVHAQPHGAAHVALARDDVQLLGHGGDHRVGGGRFELGGVGAGMPARFRAASMTMHWRPRHRPSSGILFSRA